MRLPIISSYPNKRQRAVGAFKGLNENLVSAPAEFSAMKNMSDRLYPAIATRLPRGTTLRTFSVPNGLYYKNHLFYIEGTTCYYNGEVVSGLTVTNGRKRIVGMGAYICIFPDKKIFNTATGEITSIEASYTQSGTITFQELSTDSVFTKITATGIQNAVKQYDGVEIAGVNDDAFKVDGQPTTKVITEIGTNYIVVTASIQNSWTGDAEILASGSSTRINGTGIQEKFKTNDKVKVVGCTDSALNVTDRTVTSKGTNYIIISGSFPAKNYTQSGTLTFEYYYSGSDKTKISGGNLGTMFTEGDVVTIAGCSNSAYNGTKIIRQAGTNYILVDGTLTTAFTQASGVTITRTKASAEDIIVKRTAFTQSSGITIKRKSPDMDFVCEHNNRLWGCNSLNHEVYASKLGDPTNWNCYEGLSTDSYTVTVGSDGDFTGCISHSGYVLFFKENSIHVMYGAKPANFQLNSRNAPGVRKGCEDSLQVVAETLYYVGRNGVYAYDGSIPLKISNNIISELTEARASQQNNIYYLSCLKDGKQTLLTYDPKYQIWDVEDDTKFDFATYGDGRLYYIDGNKELTTITGENDEQIWWSIESGDLTENALDEKYISKAQFNFVLSTGAEANIYFKYDDDPLWEKKGTIYSTKQTTYTLPIIARRCNRFRWKMEGKGQIKLMAMAINIEGGSELNGSIQPWKRR